MCLFLNFKYMQTNDNLLDLGRIKFDLTLRRLINGTNSTFLRNKEFYLFEYFIKNRGKILNRTQILEEVWDRNICCPTNTVDVHVSNLRQKLKAFNCSDIIKTVHCVGYILEI